MRISDLSSDVCSSDLIARPDSVVVCSSHQARNGVAAIDAIVEPAPIAAVLALLQFVTFGNFDFTPACRECAGATGRWHSQTRDLERRDVGAIHFGHQAPAQVEIAGVELLPIIRGVHQLPGHAVEAVLARSNDVPYAPAMAVVCV